MQVIETFGGKFGYLIRCRSEDDNERRRHVVDFDVYRVCSYAADGTPEVKRRVEPDSTAPATDLDAAELTLRASIKWDHCGDLRFGSDEGGPPDGYLHFCGADGVGLFADLLRHLWRRAEELMPGTWDRP